MSQEPVEEKEEEDVREDEERVELKQLLILKLTLIVQQMVNRSIEKFAGN